jgi:23S rRNA (uridine2552-2'-O)-methyltransferase
MSRSKSSGAWLAEHFTDEYVLRARREGYRSRAIYKLMELDERDRLLRPGMTVVDLGAAPGGWSQYVAQRVGPRGKVVALDILPMDPLAGVEVMQADFTEESALTALRTVLGGRSVDLVISDMAPNISGVESVDQPRAMYLAELALEFATEVLKPGGQFLVKAFQGQGYAAYYKQLQARFTKVVTRKPKASRPRSPEMYLLASGFRGGS